MPKYKLSNGKYIFVEDTDVQDFLNSEVGKGAELIQEGPVLNEIESPVGGFFGEQAKTNAVVAPVATATAKQQSATNTASPSVDGSLVQQSNKNNKIEIPEPSKPVTQKEAESIFSYIDNINSIKDPVAKDVITLLNGSEYDKTKNRFKRSNKEAKLFRQDAVEVTKAMRQMYKGLGLEFNTKLEEGFLNDISSILFGPDVDDDTVVVTLGDKKINLETNTTDDNAYIRNIKKIEKLIVDNKKSINIEQWTSNINKTIEDYNEIESIDKASKEAEDKANKDFINNTALFEPVKKIVPAGGGMYGSYTPVTVIDYPYKKELDDVKSTLLKQNPKIDKEKLDELAKNIVRQNLAEDYVIEAKYSAREKAISNGNISQEVMYATSSFMTSDKAEKYNESAKKAEISEEIAITANSALNLAYKSIMNGLDDSEGLDLVEAINKLGIPFDYSDTSKVKLKNGREVNKQLLDAYSKLVEKNKAAAINFNKYIDKADQEAAGIEDLNLSMEASSKNYDLSEKYLANIGVGFTDIGVGLIRTGAEVLRFDEDGALGDLGASYSDWSQDIRGSFVRDVSFGDAFSSAENFGKFAAQEITNQIPILATLVASGGTAAPYVIGASSMGGKLNDMSYEIAKGTADYSKAEMYLKSLGYGAAEGIFSALPTSRVLKNTKARWISGSKTKGTSLIDDGVKAWVKEKTPGLLLDTGMESFGEGLTTATQNLIDGKPWYENIDHAAFSGFGFSLGMGGVPYARGLYNSTFSTYGSNKIIRDKINNINELSKRYKPLDGRTKEAKIIVSEIKKLSNEVNDVIISNEKIVNNHLTYKGAEKILAAEKAKADIQNEAKNIIADNTISPDVKNLKLASLKKLLNKADDFERKVKSNRSFEMNLVEFNAFKETNEAKYKEYEDKAKSFLIDEGFDNPKSELIEKKAQEYYFADEVRKDNATLSKKSGVFNGNFKSFETKEEALNYVNSLNFNDGELKEKILNGIKIGNDGVALEGTGLTIAVVESQVANQRKQTKTHEITHQAMFKILEDEGNLNALQVIADQLKYTLRKTDRKLYNKFIRQFADADEVNNPKEVISRFTELVADNEVTFSERGKGIAGLFGAMVQKKFSDKYDFNFRGENDIFNFVVGLGKKIKAGELTVEDIKEAKESKAVKTAIERGSRAKGIINKGTSFSKSAEDIQSEIIALEGLYDEQLIDYYEYESKIDALETQLEQAKKAPKEQPKTTKVVTKVGVSDIEDQIDALNNDFYDGVIDDIEHEQRLDILEAKLKQAKLQVSNPKEAKKQQEDTVKKSIEKFKKEVSEETISDKNKNIAKINEDIANEILELGVNKVTDIKDPIKQKEIIDKLGRNNLGAVTNLTKRATAAGKDLAIDDNLKIGYDEFFSGFSEELSALIKSYKVEVDGKKVPFGAYMNKNLPLRYGQILDKALKGTIEGSKSLDINSGEKGFAGNIIDEGSGGFDAETSADRGLPAGELIDVTTFRKVKDKIDDIKESIDLTGVDVAGLTYRKIQDDYSGSVGAEIIGLWDRNAKPEKDQDRNNFQKLAERIEGTRTLNYGKDTGGEAEVRAMQGLFLDYNDAVRFIKTIPEFNVAPFETTIDKQGRSIDLTEDARGYSTGISNKLLKEFYEPYIDPKATSKDKNVSKTAITSPSGRGKGKTSQVAKVYRLKPEYRGSISRQTVQELQKTIGITPAGEAFIPMKGPNRTEFGTALQGLTKMYAANVANTVIRKKIVEEGITSENKSIEKVLADIGGGKSSVMFSKADNLGLNVSFETPQLGEVLFSKKARLEYESVLRKKRPDIENPKEQVEALIKWGDSLEGVPDSKKTKFKKLGLYYMANGFVIMPEDGYKVVEAVRLSDANKVDPYSVKNPNELIEKYQTKTKGTRINPDKVKEFSNKKVFEEGVTVYDVEDSKAGQLAVRKAIDTNWGFKANPWCLTARKEGNKYVETNEAESKEEAEELIADYKKEGYAAEIFHTYMHEGKKIFEIEVREPDPDPENLSLAFEFWGTYNKKGGGFKIAFQNNKLLSFRDGNELDWWDRLDTSSKRIKLKDKKISKQDSVEEFINPETGKKESRRTIKTIEDGNAKVKEVYDIDGNLEERTYKQEVEEDIFLSINESFNIKEDQKIVQVENLINDTRKNVTTILDKETGETKIITNIRGKKYHEFTRQIEKDGIVRTEIETIVSLADNKTIYNAEIYKGEFKVDINNLEDTDFQYSTELDEYFDDIIKGDESSLSFSSATEMHSKQVVGNRWYEIDTTLPESKFNKQKEKYLKNYEWLMENSIIPALPPHHWINRKNTKNSKVKSYTEKANKEHARRESIRSAIKSINTKYRKRRFGSISPSKLYGETEILIEKNLFEGILAKTNKNNIKKWENIWTEIARVARQKPSTIPLLTSLIKSSSHSTTHWHRIGAEFVGVERGVSFDEESQRYFDYEHALQANQAAFILWKAALNPNVNFKEKLKEVKDNYKLIALSVESHRRVNKFFKTKMPEDWKSWVERYFNKKIASLEGGINPDNIIFFNESQDGWGQSAREKYNVEADGSVALFSAGRSRLNAEFSAGRSRLDAEFNEILENKTGILASDNISEVKAKMIADNKRNINFFIPPSAEDFVGLLYATLGKGKVGEKQMMFYDRTLLKPYARAMQAITRDRMDLGRAFKSIRTQFEATPKDLKEKVPNSLLTKEQAVRIYIWDSTGKEVPGLSVEEVNEAANYVANNKKLKDFADQVMRLNPGSTYNPPSKTWTTGNIATDLLETLNTSRRAKHLGRWQQNVDEIFSEENLNKLEAAYGTRYRKAMENMLTRMATGRNRTYGTDSQTAQWIDWVNGAVGSIMFLNNRSAVLQTLSSANFINFSDNNIIAAGKAFANQKQYWADFATLINSDYLLERRDSLKINVNEADIAEAASKNGVRGAINYMLKLGFTPTKFADSFAIASGGSTFYRNRINSLIKKGMDPVAAEKAAMRDFIETSEESQQSSRPDKISQEQAGPLGRIILAFANTSAQYARITKKAASDLKNRRGSDKENISKILYYSFVQNLIFNALQQAIFAFAFGEEEEDEGLIDDKKLNIANGMLDSVIRGTGIAGAVFSVVKNTALKIHKESEKKNPKYEDMVFEAIKISPPISSKVSKIKSAGRTMSWDMKEIKAKGIDVTSPAVGAGAQVVSAITNLPLDRVVKKIENLAAASDSELETYKRLALVLGWGKWELGIKEEEKKKEAKNKSTKRSSSVRERVLRKTIIK